MKILHLFDVIHSISSTRQKRRRLWFIPILCASSTLTCTREHRSSLWIMHHMGHCAIVTRKERLFLLPPLCSMSKRLLLHFNMLMTAILSIGMSSRKRADWLHNDLLLSDFGIAFLQNGAYIATVL